VANAANVHVPLSVPAITDTNHGNSQAGSAFQTLPLVLTPINHQGYVMSSTTGLKGELIRLINLLTVKRTIFLKKILFYFLKN
jgi:hypothetical protein